MTRSTTSLWFKTKVFSEGLKSDSVVKLFAITLRRVGRVGGSYLLLLIVH